MFSHSQKVMHHHINTHADRLESLLSFLNLCLSTNDNQAENIKTQAGDGVSAAMMHGGLSKADAHAAAAESRQAQHAVRFTALQ